MTRIKTFAADNKFRFNCPVFGAEVAIIDCLNLREDVARGKRPEERRGCQACMRASKCPIPRLIQVTARTGEDHYHASEARVGQLRPELLDFIAPIVVPEHMLNEHGVPPTEREIILALNENIAAGRRGKAKPVGKVQLEDASKRRAATAAPDADERAAAAGDMSAAIKKAVAKETTTRINDPAAETVKITVEVPKGSLSVPAEKSPQKAAGGDSPAKVQSPRPTSPTPPAANVANPSGSDLANSPRKAPSLLELARQKRAAQAQA